MRTGLSLVAAIGVLAAVLAPLAGIGSAALAQPPSRRAARDLVPTLLSIGVIRHFATRYDR